MGQWVQLWFKRLFMALVAALAQTTFEGFRVQMREAARQDPDFEPERWTPPQAQRRALQGVGAMAGLLEMTAAMLRARGRELGQQFGEDFDAIVQASRRACV